MVNVNQRNCGD